MYSGQNICVNVSESKIAELVFDVKESPVNIFNKRTVDELSQALDVLDDQSEIINGLVIRSGNFIGHNSGCIIN